MIFKRGNLSTLNNTPLNEGMLYFTTDSDSSIYLDAKNEYNNLVRYKIFGFKASDIISSESDASINTFVNNSNTSFMKATDIADTYDTTNKIAIGNGYYANVIGNNIEDSLYLNKPTIKSTIQFIQNNARSKLTSLWTNSNPSTTWSGGGDVTITLTDTYLGYIMLVKSYLGDNTLQPIVFFNLPTTITDNMISNVTPKIYGKEARMWVQNNDNTFDVTLYIGINANNPKQILVHRYSYGDYGEELTDPNNYMIPMQLYGWRI